MSFGILKMSFVWRPTTCLQKRSSVFQLLDIEVFRSDVQSAQLATRRYRLRYDGFIVLSHAAQQKLQRHSQQLAPAISRWDAEPSGPAFSTPNACARNLFCARAKVNFPEQINPHNLSLKMPLGELSRQLTKWRVVLFGSLYLSWRNNILFMMSFRIPPSRDVIQATLSSITSHKRKTSILFTWYRSVHQQNTARVLHKKNRVLILMAVPLKRL